MIRTIFSEGLLFLLPFGVFAFYLVFSRRNPMQWAHWSEQTSWLVLAGLGLAVAALLITGLVAERRNGAYLPSHMENGRLVPGQFR